MSVEFCTDTELVSSAILMTANVLYQGNTLTHQGMLREVGEPYGRASGIALACWNCPVGGVTIATKPPEMTPYCFGTVSSQSGVATITRPTTTLNGSTAGRPSARLRRRTTPDIFRLWRKIGIDENCRTLGARAPSRSLLSRPPIAGPRLAGNNPQSQQIGLQAHAADGTRVANHGFHSLRQRDRYARFVQPTPVNTSPIHI